MEFLNFTDLTESDNDSETKVKLNQGDQDFIEDTEIKTIRDC